MIRLNILYVNTKYQGGGAEKVARQLYIKMGQIENINVFYLAGRSSGGKGEVSTVYDENVVLKIYNLGKRIFTNNARKKDYLFRRKIISIIKREHTNIVHFHNIHGNYMGMEDLIEIQKYCKVIWTLHDMWAMTGHCAYPIQCDKWIMADCRFCLNLKLYPKLRVDIAEHIYKMKKKLFVNKGIIFVVPSEWLLRQCERSFLAQETRRLIYNGVNTSVFFPMDKDALRKKYKISHEKIVLMFVSNNLQNPYKGVKTLEEALELIEEKEKYELIIVGGGKHLSFENDYACHNMGHVNNDEIMNELYNLSDVFVLPSRAENFPCTVLESMAAGTPVIATKTGGVVEQIDDETGWLFNDGDVKQLKDIIEHLFYEKSRLSIMKGNCRKRIKMFFSEERMIQEYRMLYENLMTL